MLRVIDPTRVPRHFNGCHPHSLVQVWNFTAKIEKQTRRRQYLEGELDKAMQDVEALKREKRMEKKNCNKYYHYLVKRWAFKVIGIEDQFIHELRYEPGRYPEILRALYGYGRRIKALKRQRDNILYWEAILKEERALITADQREFKRLYGHIFKDPAPFAALDDAVRAVDSITKAWSKTCYQLKTDRDVQTLLEDANVRIKAAAGFVELAQQASTRRPRERGTTKFSVERVNLSRALRQVCMVRELAKEAQARSLEVVGFYPADAFTEASDVSQAFEEVNRCIHSVWAMLVQARDRHRDTRRKFNDECNALNNAREELDEKGELMLKYLADNFEPHEIPPGFDSLVSKYRENKR
ncbi:hypothetical protein GGR58DRAFT_9343 [Xylaria digitata]|nr:hypothetical protein GGR58DRAFT_9343 [Xylaria digitata]